MRTLETTEAAIYKYYDNIPQTTGKEIEKRITDLLNSSGIMFHIFGRTKSKESILKKMKAKAESKYICEGKKMQDVVGIRIVLYFADDIDNCIRLLNKTFTVVDKQHDNPDPEVFKPIRINYVFMIPDEIAFLPETEANQCLIDHTFEVQIRSIFSEGWHEVEHDLRYKHQNDWKNADQLSRYFNGILAVLETCDNNIISVCNTLAEEKYKEKDWESMLRNHFRLRFQDEKINENLLETIYADSDFALKLYQYRRADLMEIFSQTKVPRTYNNAIYLINLDYIKNSLVERGTPKHIITQYERYIAIS